MKRSPIKPGTTPLQRKTPLVNKTPMARGVAQLKTTAPMKKSGYLRQRRPGKPKREDKPLADLCRGQACFLLLPGIERHDPGTVVACHSNQARDGKAMGLKAADEKTVPGCWLCHRELDQGARFTREEKFALWDDAYRRWMPVRQSLSAQEQKVP